MFRYSVTPEINLSAQSYLPRRFTGILIFKGLNARRLYKSLGAKGLIKENVWKGYREIS
jgi:hypothetical protein